MLTRPCVWYITAISKRHEIDDWNTTEPEFLCVPFALCSQCVSSFIWHSVVSKSPHSGATQVQFRALSFCQTTLPLWLMKLLRAGHLPPVTSASPSSLSIFVRLEHHVVHNITATLQADWPFLSCCDQINLDGSETMNDDITIWAPATCRSKNRLVFGQNKCLRTESNVVWRNGSWGRNCGEDWVFFPFWVT